jgi:hypothetical protein
MSRESRASQVLVHSSSRVLESRLLFAVALAASRICVAGLLFLGDVDPPPHLQTGVVLKMCSRDCVQAKASSEPGNSHSRGQIVTGTNVMLQP